MDMRRRSPVINREATSFDASQVEKASTTADASRLCRGFEAPLISKHLQFTVFTYERSIESIIITDWWPGNMPDQIKFDNKLFLINKLKRDIQSYISTSNKLMLSFRPKHLSNTKPVLVCPKIETDG